MASFNYTVDTAPMADEMRSVSRHVDGTTTAVVAMQVAVIEAEALAADHICANVNKGFYSLIRSQISQKIARLQSEVNSHLTQLQAQSQAMRAIKSRMEKDYNMITGRYLKLFGALNNNLKHRIFELDRPAVDLASTNVTKLTNRYRYSTTTVAVNQLESVNSSQRVLSANVKKRGEAAILSLQRFIAEMNKQQRLTNHILITNQPFSNQGAIYLPVAVYERCFSADSLPDTEIESPVSSFKPSAVQQLKNSAYGQAPSLNWQVNGDVSQAVKNEFNRLAYASDLEKKIKDTAFKLFDGHTFHTI
ncbi:MAG TPA: hypothetical protein VGM63_00420 [Mucilaginibacter sp.]|jgi:hypothetical protein